MEFSSSDYTKRLGRETDQQPRAFGFNLTTATWQLSRLISRIAAHRLVQFSHAESRMLVLSLMKFDTQVSIRRNQCLRLKLTKLLINLAEVYLKTIPVDLRKRILKILMTHRPNPNDLKRILSV